MAYSSPSIRHHEADCGLKSELLSGHTFCVTPDLLLEAVGDGKAHYGTTAVFNLLWKYTNAKAGVAWPSLQTIANKLSISKTQAKKLVKQLVELGFVTKQQRKNSKNSHLSNVYTVHLAPAGKADDVNQRGGSHCDLGVGHNVTSIKKDGYKKLSPDSDLTETEAPVGVAGERDPGKERNDEAVGCSAPQPNPASPLVETRAEEEDDAVGRICRRIQSQHVKNGLDRPKISASWLRQARKLLVEGAPGWEKKRAIPAEEVESLLVWALGDSFWSPRITSPAALARNWSTLKTRRKLAASQPTRGVLDVRSDDSPSIDLEGTQAGYTPVRPELQERTPFNLDPAAATTDQAAAKSRIADMRDRLKVHL